MVGKASMHYPTLFSLWPIFPVESKNYTSGIFYKDHNLCLFAFLFQKIWIKWTEIQNWNKIQMQKLTIMGFICSFCYVLLISDRKIMIETSKA